MLHQHVNPTVLKSPWLAPVSSVVSVVRTFAPQSLQDAREAQGSQSARIRARGPDCADVCKGATTLEIRPNKNVWFVAFIFGGCQLQFERARCLEAASVTNMKDALMNCWQSSAGSLIRDTVAASHRRYTGQRSHWHVYTSCVCKRSGWSRPFVRLLSGLSLLIQFDVETTKKTWCVFLDHTMFLSHC